MEEQYVYEPFVIYSCGSASCPGHHQNQKYPDTNAKNLCPDRPQYAFPYKDSWTMYCNKQCQGRKFTPLDNKDSGIRCSCDKKYHASCAYNQLTIESYKEIFEECGDFKIADKRYKCNICGHSFCYTHLQKHGYELINKGTVTEFTFTLFK